LDQAQREPQRYRVVDAARPLDEVQATLRALLTNFCKHAS